MTKSRGGEKGPQAWLVVSALVSVQVLFGLNYIISKILVGVFPPLVWASMRSFMAALLLLGFCLASGRPHPKGGWKYFGPLFGFAILGTILNQAAFQVGLHYTTSTNSAILNTLIPVFTLLIVTIRGQESLTPKRAVGFLVAFTGVLVIRKVENLSLSDRTLIGDLLMIVNCLSYALFLSFGKKFLEEHDPVWTTTWLFVYGCVGISLIAIPDWMSFTMPVMTTGIWASGAFAVLGATLATYFLSFWSLAHTKSSSVALFVYLQPVVTSLVAWIWMGQVITPRTAFASFLIFLAMLLALSRASAKKVKPVLAEV